MYFASKKGGGSFYCRIFFCSRLESAENRNLGGSVSDTQSEISLPKCHLTLEIFHTFCSTEAKQGSVNKLIELHSQVWESDSETNRAMHTVLPYKILMEPSLPNTVRRPPTVLDLKLFMSQACQNYIFSSKIMFFFCK